MRAKCITNIYILFSYVNQNVDMNPTSTCLDNFPDPFDLMSSPVGKRNPGVLSPSPASKGYQGMLSPSPIGKRIQGMLSPKMVYLCLEQTVVGILFFSLALF